MQIKTTVEGDASTIISAVLSWVVNPASTKHCCITGGPGAGKSHMIKKLIEQFNLMVDLGMLGEVTDSLTPCSTTHDSCAVLGKFLGMSVPVPTIHSKFDIKISRGKPYFTYGSSKFFAEDLGIFVNRPGFSPHSEIIVCDEANYIENDIIKLIGAKNPGVRIIFVGSKHQLSMGSGQSDVFNNGYDEFLLNTKWRASNQEVQEVYDITENDVINKTITDIPANNSLHYMDEATWLATMQNAYTSPKNLSVCTLAYSNKRVLELVNTIREMKGLSTDKPFDLGKPMQCLFRGSRTIPKNNPKLITDMDVTGMVPYFIRVKNNKGMELRSYVTNTIEEFHYRRKTDNQTRDYETYPTLVASTEARTINGVQGATYDFIFLDLRDMLGSVFKYDKENFRRLRHVGMTRHTTKLFILV